MRNDDEKVLFPWDNTEPDRGSDRYWYQPGFIDDLFKEPHNGAWAVCLCDIVHKQVGWFFGSSRMLENIYMIIFLPFESGFGRSSLNSGWGNTRANPCHGIIQRKILILMMSSCSLAPCCPSYYHHYQAVTSWQYDTHLIKICCNTIPSSTRHYCRMTIHISIGRPDNHLRSLTYWWHQVACLAKPHHPNGFTL